MAIVSTQEVQQVAALARMRLGAEPLAKLAAQIDRILAYVAQLQAMPTDGVEPTSHVVELSNVMRPDQRRPSLPPEAVTRLAPARHHALVKVPKIID